MSRSPGATKPPPPAASTVIVQEPPGAREAPHVDSGIEKMLGIMEIAAVMLIADASVFFTITVCVELPTLTGKLSLPGETLGTGWP